MAVFRRSAGEADSPVFAPEAPSWMAVGQSYLGGFYEGVTAAPVMTVGSSPTTSIESFSFDLLSRMGPASWGVTGWASSDAGALDFYLPPEVGAGPARGGRASLFGNRPYGQLPLGLTSASYLMGERSVAQEDESLIFWPTRRPRFSTNPIAQQKSRPPRPRPLPKGPVGQVISSAPPRQKVLGPPASSRRVHRVLSQASPPALLKGEGVAQGAQGDVSQTPPAPSYPIDSEVIESGSVGYDQGLVEEVQGEQSAAFVPSDPIAEELPQSENGLASEPVGSATSQSGSVDDGPAILNSDVGIPVVSPRKTVESISQPGRSAQRAGEKSVVIPSSPGGASAGKPVVHVGDEARGFRPPQRVLEPRRRVVEPVSTETTSGAGVREARLSLESARDQASRGRGSIDIAEGHSSSLLVSVKGRSTGLQPRLGALVTGEAPSLAEQSALEVPSQGRRSRQDAFAAENTESAKKTQSAVVDTAAEPRQEAQATLDKEVLSPSVVELEPPQIESIHGQEPSSMLGKSETPTQSVDEEQARTPTKRVSGTASEGAVGPLPAQVGEAAQVAVHKARTQAVSSKQTSQSKTQSKGDEASVQPSLAAKEAKQGDVDSRIGAQGTVQGPEQSAIASEHPAQDSLFVDEALSSFEPSSNTVSPEIVPPIEGLQSEGSSSLGELVPQSAAPISAEPAAAPIGWRSTPGALTSSWALAPEQVAQDLSHFSPLMGGIFRAANASAELVSPAARTVFSPVVPGSSAPESRSTQKASSLSQMARLRSAVDGATLLAGDKAPETTLPSEAQTPGRRRVRFGTSTTLPSASPSSIGASGTGQKSILRSVLGQSEPSFARSFDIRRTVAAEAFDAVPERDGNAAKRSQLGIRGPLSTSQVVRAEASFPEEQGLADTSEPRRRRDVRTPPEAPGIKVQKVAPVSPGQGFVSKEEVPREVASQSVEAAASQKTATSATQATVSQGPGVLSRPGAQSESVSVTAKGDRTSNGTEKSSAGAVPSRGGVKAQPGAVASQQSANRATPEEIAAQESFSNSKQAQVLTEPSASTIEQLDGSLGTLPTQSELQSDGSQAFVTQDNFVESIEGEPLADRMSAAEFGSLTEAVPGTEAAFVARRVARAPVFSEDGGHLPTPLISSAWFADELPGKVSSSAAIQQASKQRGSVLAANDPSAGRGIALPESSFQSLVQQGDVIPGRPLDGASDLDKARSAFQWKSLLPARLQWLQGAAKAEEVAPILPPRRWRAAAAGQELDVPVDSTKPLPISSTSAEKASQTSSAMPRLSSEQPVVPTTASLSAAQQISRQIGALAPLISQGLIAPPSVSGGSGSDSGNSAQILAQALLNEKPGAGPITVSQALQGHSKGAPAQKRGGFDAHLLANRIAPLISAVTGRPLPGDKATTVQKTDGAALSQAAQARRDFVASQLFGQDPSTPADGENQGSPLNSGPVVSPLAHRTPLAHAASATVVSGERAPDGVEALGERVPALRRRRQFASDILAVQGDSVAASPSKSAASAGQGVASEELKTVSDGSQGIAQPPEKLAELSKQAVELSKQVELSTSESAPNEVPESPISKSVLPPGSREDLGEAPVAGPLGVRDSLSADGDGFSRDGTGLLESQESTVQSMVQSPELSPVRKGSSDATESLERVVPQELSEHVEAGGGERTQDDIDVDSSLGSDVEQPMVGALRRFAAPQQGEPFSWSDLLANQLSWLVDEPGSAFEGWLPGAQNKAGQGAARTRDIRRTLAMNPGEMGLVTGERALEVPQEFSGRPTRQRFDQQSGNLVLEVQGLDREWVALPSSSLPSGQVVSPSTGLEERALKSVAAQLQGQRATSPGSVSADLGQGTESQRLLGPSEVKESARTEVAGPQVVRRSGPGQIGAGELGNAQASEPGFSGATVSGLPSVDVQSPWASGTLFSDSRRLRAQGVEVEGVAKRRERSLVKLGPQKGWGHLPFPLTFLQPMDLGDPPGESEPTQGVAKPYQRIFGEASQGNLGTSKMPVQGTAESNAVGLRSLDTAVDSSAPMVTRTVTSSSPAQSGSPWQLGNAPHERMATGDSLRSRPLQAQPDGKRAFDLSQALPAGVSLSRAISLSGSPAGATAQTAKFDWSRLIPSQLGWLMGESPLQSAEKTPLRRHISIPRASQGMGTLPEGNVVRAAEGPSSATAGQAIRSLISGSPALGTAEALSTLASRRGSSSSSTPAARWHLSDDLTRRWQAVASDLTVAGAAGTGPLADVAQAVRSFLEVGSEGGAALAAATKQLTSMAQFQESFASATGGRRDGRPLSSPGQKLVSGRRQSAPSMAASTQSVSRSSLGFLFKPAGRVSAQRGPSWSPQSSLIERFNPRLHEPMDDTALVSQSGSGAFDSVSMTQILQGLSRVEKAPARSKQAYPGSPEDNTSSVKVGLAGLVGRRLSGKDTAPSIKVPKPRSGSSSSFAAGSVDDSPITSGSSISSWASQRVSGRATPPRGRGTPSLVRESQANPGALFAPSAARGLERSASPDLGMTLSGPIKQALIQAESTPMSAPPLFKERDAAPVSASSDSSDGNSGAGQADGDERAVGLEEVIEEVRWRLQLEQKWQDELD